VRLLLDTNILSDVVRNPSGRAAAHLSLMKPGEAATSIIAAAELRFGYVRVASKRLEHLIEGVLSNLEIISWEAPADMAYARIRTLLERRGAGVGQNDMLIAAHALTLNVALVTANERHFTRIPGLKVLNWLGKAPDE